MTTVEPSIESSGYESVAEFYAGKSVFITGGTGFLGKVFIEKLLYSCKDIVNVFILIRHKKDANVIERVQQLISKPLFGRIRSERPDDLKKVIPINGDISQPGLGLSSTDERILIDKVSVVFHVAATVKFNERLDIAVNTNVRGTQSVLNLCHRMKNIKAFVHVSTAYCNTDQQVLQEKIYPPRADLCDVFKYIEQPHLDEEQIKDHFLKGLPNTYTFTKGLAENYVEEHRGNIPTVIIRPSIVSPAFREPLAGWTDNWFGAAGILTATVKGANRAVLGDGNNVLDVIPVDYVSNVTIVAAAKCSKVNSLTVYNCCTSSCNPVTIRNFFSSFKNSAVNIGFHDNSYPTVLFTNSEWLVNIITFFLQTIPAYIADLFVRLSGKQPRHVKLQSRIVFGRDLLKFFTTHSWEMKANNVRSLHASLQHTDRDLFPCDPSEMNWDEYTNIFVRGIKRYLMS